MEEGQERLKNYVNSLQRPTLIIYYEDLLKNPEEVFGWVTGFLSLPPAPLSPKTKKNTSDNLRHVISNFEELKLYYMTTQYEAMFDEATK